MQPDRVALFGYAHVPWMAKNQRMIPDEALPEADARYAKARAAVEEGDLPIAKGHVLSDDDRIRGYVIEQLMCQGTVDLVDVSREFALSADGWCEELERLEDPAEDGLVALDGGVVSLTGRGRPLAHIVAVVFDSYRQEAASRHSMAV